MTGTLLLNSPLDAFVPLKFIGKENSTWTNFKNYYCVYEQKFGHNQIVAYKNINVLKEEIDSCSLRRDKSILNLPPKTIIPEFIDMDSTQQKFYEDMMNGIVDDIDKVKINTTNLLGMITRLRQATSAPSVLSSSEIIPTKIERAIDLIEEIISGGEKVVVFSYFKEPLYIFKADATVEGQTGPVVSYEIYYPLDGIHLSSLDLGVCEGMDIQIIIPTNVFFHLYAYWLSKIS